MFEQARFWGIPEHPFVAANHQVTVMVGTQVVDGTGSGQCGLFHNAVGGESQDAGVVTQPQRVAAAGKADGIFVVLMASHLILPHKLPVGTENVQFS